MLRPQRILSLLFIPLLLGAGCSDLDSGAFSIAPPQSGIWSFHLIADGNQLEGNACGSMAGALSSIGEALLNVTQDGTFATMQLDNQSLVFHRLESTSADYQTNTRHFPVRNGTGSVYFDFTANTSDTIVGTLHWDNSQGCTADYPYTMELTQAMANTGTAPFTLSEGMYQMSVNNLLSDCDASITGFTNMPTTLTISPVYDMDTSADSTTEFTVEPIGTILEQIPGSNTYTQTDSTFDIGLPTDSAGDVLLDYNNTSFDASMEIEVQADGSATGVLYITSDACNMSAGINLTQ